MLSVLFIISVFAIVVFITAHFFDVEEADDAITIWIIVAVVSFIFK